MAFSVIRLIDLLNEFGEEFAKELFSDFSCPINEDVEFFLKEKAISFQRMDIWRVSRKETLGRVFCDCTKNSAHQEKCNENAAQTLNRHKIE
jgi:hypothetical protein